MIKQPPELRSPPAAVNDSKNHSETFGGLNKTRGSEPPVEGEPPIPEVQNHTQNASNGSSGDTGGLINT